MLKPVNIAAIADSLRQFTEALDVIHWLRDNDLLESGAPDEVLAYDYAVRFSQHRADLESTIGLTVIDNQPVHRRQ
jgi:hypothetical protein